MSDPKHHHLLMIGLPEAGKTSFLGALWYMVDQTHLDCRLTLENVGPERKYLNEIRSVWLKCRPVPRNKVDVQEIISMHLRDRLTGDSVVLTVPDLSGEAFKRQWTKRELTVGYDKAMRDANGGMLFIHASGIQKPQKIFSINEAVRSLGRGADRRTRRNLQSPPPKWDSEGTPTQVKLVELLQIISSRDYFHPPFRLAIIISAFDLLSKSEITPQAFFERELPFLNQFLLGNQHLFHIMFYGISAQGERYAYPTIEANMFKDVPGLAKRLVAADDPLTKWIWAKLDPASQATLKEGADEGAIRKILLEHFNGLLSNSDLFDPERFLSVTFRRKTEALLGEVQNKHLEKAAEGLILNRMLLDDAFPNELSRDWSNGEEQARLEALVPAQRVSVVGTDTTQRHDITEPIQWLMQPT